MKNRERRMGGVRANISVAVVGALLATPWAMVVGCGDTEPPPRYYEDMGTDSAPLLPPPRTWIDASVEKGGQAEWHPFPQVTEEAIAEREAKRTARQGRPSGAQSGGGGSASPEAEAAIRKFIEDFNTTQASGDFDKLGSFFVEEQQKGAADLMKAQKALMEKLKALAEAIREKAPAAVEPLTEQLAMLAKQNDAPLRVENLTEVSATEIAGKDVGSEGVPMPESMSEVRFLRVGEEWKLKHPAVEAASAFVSTVPTILTQLDGMIEEVRSGSVPADAVAKQFSGMIAALMPSAGDSADKAPEAAKGADEKPDEKGDADDR